MGNPNARPKRGSIRRFGSTQSNTTNGSAVSPKTLSKKKNFSTNDIMDENEMKTDLTANTLAALALEETSPTRPELKFKSYKTGTLITNNGVPATAFIAPFPPPKPSPKFSQLNAATPAFVPFTPQRHAAIPAIPVLPAPVTPTFEMVQNLLQDIRFSPNQSPIHRIAYHSPHGHHGQHHNPYCSPPSTMNTESFNTTPTSQPPIGPSRPPRTYYQRAAKSKKDIIITSDGVIRNAVKVTERYLPNGTPYHSYTSEFESSDYDFVNDFNIMSYKVKTELLNIKQVEIVVKLENYDNHEKAKEARTSKRGDIKDKGKEKAKKAEISNAAEAKVNEKVNLVEASKAANVEGKGKEKDEVTPQTKIATVIDIINALGPDFAANTKNLTVTLDFLSIPVLELPTPLIPTGPRAVSPLSPQGPLILGPNFSFLTDLVRVLQTFTGLKHMVVNLRVLSAHNPRPITIPQLTLILPFYDLGFTEWKVSYQTEFLSTSVPVRDHDYPLKWLDRERNKILRERERRVENAVFVRRSSVNGRVATWNKRK